MISRYVHINVSTSLLSLLLLLSGFFLSVHAQTDRSPKTRAQQGKVWVTNFKEGLELGRKHHQPVLLDLYAPWCGYCRKLQKKIYPLPQVRSVTKKFIRVRIDGEKNPHLMGRYQAKGFPTIILMDHNGVYIDSIRGLPTTKILIRKLRDVHRRFGKRQGQILQNLKQKPLNIETNFAAGKYYFEAGSYSLAHSYFLKCWQLGKKKKLSSKKANATRKALYNGTVSLMHLNKYAQASKQWDTYLQYYPKKSQERIYARYYRGLSLYYQNKKKAASADLHFAAKHVKNPEDRYLAESLTQSISP